MTKVLDPNNKPAGSERMNGPRLIGELINEYFQHSDSPLAKGYREFLASTEGAPDAGGVAVETTGPYKNTMLCVDVKTILIDDRILKLGKKYVGIIVMDAEDHLRFEEIQKRVSKEIRNFQFFPGQTINGTIRPEDLHVRLNFKEIYFGPDFDIDAYSIAVMLEVRKALNEAKSLIEEKAFTK